MTAGAAPKRIVVAVDDSAHARAAVEAAADFARRLGAGVTALFVEDQELLHAAGLPFVHEIGRDAATRPLETPRVERRFRSVVRAAREACASAAARCRVEVRLEVVRGAVPREIAAAAGRDDIVFLGRSGAPPATAHADPSRTASPRRDALGRTTRSVLASTSAIVAVVPAARGDGRPVAVVFDGSAASRRALDLAVLLDGDSSGGLAILEVEDGSGGDGLVGHDAIAATIRGARVLPVAASMAAIATAARRLDARAVVLARQSATPEGDGVPALVSSVDCPVFVVG